LTTDSQHGVRQYVHPLPNGMTLLAEQTAALQSVSVLLMLPGGTGYDAPGMAGAATLHVEWTTRGAGGRDARALTQAFDLMGVQRSSWADVTFGAYRATLLSEHLAPTLSLYADMIQRPHLDDAELEGARELCLQQLQALEDEPAQRLSVLIKERYFGFPRGRCSLGTRAEVEALTPAVLRADGLERYGTQGAYIVVAGNFDWPSLKAQVEELFGGWHKATRPAPADQPAPRGYVHLPHPAEQVHIGLAWDAPAERTPQSHLHQVGTQVLSGGMAARLFAEVREKRGLCYSVHAGYQSYLDQGFMMGYSATTPERAQQTLDQFIHETVRLNEGVTAAELDRALVGIKSRIIMQGESAAARVSALAYDYYHYQRLRSLAEVRQHYQQITLDELNTWLAGQKAGPFTVVTVGPEPLVVNY
jgi:predicted Zn-dependent peptidase